MFICLCINWLSDGGADVLLLEIPSWGLLYESERDPVQVSLGKQKLIVLSVRRKRSEMMTGLFVNEDLTRFSSVNTRAAVVGQQLKLKTFGIINITLKRRNRGMFRWPCGRLPTKGHTF